MSAFSVGLEYSPTIVEAEITTEHGAHVKINESGCCARHPDIMLRKKLTGLRKRTTGKCWEIIQQSCHKCDVIHDLEVAEKKAIHDLEVAEKKANLEEKKANLELQANERKTRMAFESLKLQQAWAQRGDSTGRTLPSSVDSEGLDSSDIIIPPGSSKADKISDGKGLKTAKKFKAATGAGLKALNQQRHKAVALASAFTNSTIPASSVSYVTSMPYSKQDKTCTYSGAYTGYINKHTGKPHGMGCLEFEKPEPSLKHEGEFRNGLEHGPGVITSKDPSNPYHVEGDFVRGELCGQCNITFADGGRFSGEFENGEQTGHGIMVEADGSRYEGEFKHSKKHGHGLYVLKNGIEYDGDFYQGFFHGKGVLKWPHGDYYIGSWKDGNKHGVGHFYSGGKKKKQRWFNGVMK